jgi:predicted nucleic acid-binding protein
MPPSPRLVYWDASVFIAYFQAGSDPEHVRRREEVRLLLQEAERGETLIVTSAFTRAEVRRGVDVPGYFAEQHAIITAFFKQPFVELVPVDRAIGELAAEYGERFNLRPPDAVQLATAVRVGATVFLAWDRHFHRKEAMAGAPIPIEEPRWTGVVQLPLEEAERPDAG